MLSRFNQRLAARSLGSRFATLVYAVISPDGRLVYSNAGHNPPALMTRNGIHRLTVGGPILGAFSGAGFEEETVHLSDRDSLIMFTDGVIEARSSLDEEFGDERLMTYLREASALPPSEMLSTVFDSVRAFCQDADQSDDITVTVSRFVST